MSRVVESAAERLWLEVGPVHFQPGEAAKVLLILFVAAYLVDKRELLDAAQRSGLEVAAS